ncbi:MAG: helix-turn-helix domain-containing protein [Candidatus Caldarchaeum sp.]|nr:helix-turn-helix domain-containing protein [Candidatus Caldarchaeum sp.]MCS7137054.1 helix-turn-helix domain-containing protein [Candidatus Caldarchaeum sp.]MDW7977450.1 helix-turn-helix domain-containing protein [Candidatus Caldarchaeum sp.]
MLEVLLRVQLACPWISELRKHVSSFDVLSCRPVFSGNGASAVVCFRGRADMDYVQSAVSKTPAVERAEFKKIGKNHGVGVINSSLCPCSKLGIPYTHVLKITVEENGMTFNLLVHSRKELNDFLKKVRSSGVSHRLLNVKQFKPRHLLTPRQEQALVHAYLKGYFNYPRPTTVNSLADDFGVSTPTYTELLRKALAKLVLKQM